MRALRATTLAQDAGTLTARATFEDPEVRLEPGRDAPSVLTIEEGRVRVDLAFPAPDLVRPLLRPLRRLPPPADRRLTAPFPAPPGRSPPTSGPSTDTTLHSPPQCCICF